MKPSLIIVGLGNPGGTYEQTRHNAGFRALDALWERYGEGEWEAKQKFLSIAAEAAIGEFPVLLVKPQTFMNRSGEAVQKLLTFYKIDPAFQLLLVSDDCDLALGEVRFRAGGGPGTHNGLKSVVEHVGETFPRLRIGLGMPPPAQDLAAWVLSVPPEMEANILTKAILEEVPQKVEEFALGRK